VSTFLVRPSGPCWPLPLRACGLPPAALRACSSDCVRFLVLIAELALLATMRDEDEESKTRGREWRGRVLVLPPG